MQARHFWYAGRHRFLLAAVREQLRRRGSAPASLSAIDFGGGAGGWIRYLNQHAPTLFSELALSDSSSQALALAQNVVGSNVARLQLDLRQLPWGAGGRWDVAFLLDVLEHIPEDALVLTQIRDALKPGGLLFVTTPALRCFWSYNDELVHHVKRYNRADYRQLAEAVGLRLLDARYFMFLLSPLLVSRLGKRRRVADMTPEQVKQTLARTHKVPFAPLNQLLRGVFSLETPLGLRVPFPWGSSILGIFQRRI
jgi:SAM-dependent methyltransferase